MKLLYIVSEFEPVQNAVSIRTKAHVDALLENGHEVTIITGPVSKNNSKYDIKTTYIDTPSNKKHFIFRLLREIVFGSEIGLRILFGKKFDHIVVTSPPFIMTLMVSLFIWLKRIPYSIDVRDRYPQVLFSLGLINEQSIFGRILLILEKKLYAGATNIITVTESLVNSIKNETCVESVYLVRNGFCETIFNCMQLRVQADIPIIVMHGNFGKFFDEKSFIKIVNELAKHSLSYQLVIIGEGSKIDSLIKRDLPNVKVLASMKQSEISDWLKLSYIGLSIHSDNSSMRGAFPVKVFEYIGCCVPSIVIPVSEAGTLIQKEGMGYTFDPSAWSEAVNMIIRLLEDTKHHEQIIQTIHRKRESFSREYQSKAFVDILT